MNYRDFNLDDWIGHISGVIEDETTLDGNEMRDLVEFLTTLKQYPTTKNDLEIVMDAMEYRTNALIENIKSEIMHFANAHCSGDDINIYDVFKVIDDCCKAENLTTKNDLGIDCISRKAVLEMAKSYNTDGWDMYTPLVVDVEDIKALPPVTPIRAKGHWIYDYISADGHRVYHCSECGCYLKPKTSEYLSDYKWCSLCGAEMKESEEE